MKQMCIRDRYKKKIEEQKLDPDTKAPILDKDGKIVTEEKEIEIPMFRPVKVFDVSQTDGKPLPELASSLSGNVPNYEAFMEALRRSAPVPITFEAIAADTDGYFSADHQKIAIRQGMSEVQTVSATVHEIAHSKLHDPKKYEMLPSWKVVQESEGGTKHDFKLDFATEKEAEQFASDMDWRYVDENQFEWRLAVEEDATAEKQAIKNRHTEEVEAESISYAVCKYFGIETGENSFGYIASWSQGKELKELRTSLETINKTSGTLISDIERHYKEICKERGIDPHAKAEPETAPIEQPTGNLTSVSYTHLWEGVPWFQSRGQWGARGYENIAPGDAIFFDWDLDGTADHVGIVIGTDGSRVYTVEGNSGDACKIKSYDLNYQSIKGYGLMNW